MRPAVTKLSGTQMSGVQAAGQRQVELAPLLRWHRGTAGPVLLWLVMALGRPLCLLSQQLIPLTAVTVPLPTADTVALLHHRVRRR